MHSPFVYNFMTEVLGNQQSISSVLNNKIVKYYTNLSNNINFINNAGAGSIAHERKDINISKFIKTVGLPKKYGTLLENIVEHYQCTNTLELGTSLGISTSYLALNSNNKVISIEANKDIYQLTKCAFTKLKIDNVQLINAYFDDVLLDVCKQNTPFSLVFIDGDHTKKATINNFNTIKPYLNKDSIVILDDIYWSKEMTQAWHEIREDLDVSISIDLFRVGLLFFRKEKLKKEHFTLWY